MNICIIIIKMEYFNLLYDVFLLLDFRTKLSFTLMSKVNKNSFHITNLCNIEEKYLIKLDKNY